LHYFAPTRPRAARFSYQPLNMRCLARLARTRLHLRVLRAFFALQHATRTPLPLPACTTTRARRQEGMAHAHRTAYLHYARLRYTLPTHLPLAWFMDVPALVQFFIWFYGSHGFCSPLFSSCAMYAIRFCCLSPAMPRLRHEHAPPAAGLLPGASPSLPSASPTLSLLRWPHRGRRPCENLSATLHSARHRTRWASRACARYLAAARLGGVLRRTADWRGRTFYGDLAEDMTMDGARTLKKAADRRSRSK